MLVAGAATGGLGSPPVPPRLHVQAERSTRQPRYLPLHDDGPRRSGRHELRPASQAVTPTRPAELLLGLV